MKRRALTLIETIIASFLLVGGFMITVALFHSALRYTSQIEKVTVATLLADRTLNEMRVWARNVTNYRSSWAPYDGVTVAAPEYPDQRIFTQVSKPAGLPIPLLSSPGTAMDSMQIASDRKSLVNSCRRVRVSVSWPPYTAASTFRLVSLIPEPRLSWRNANPIVVTLTGGAGPLAHNATTTLQAQGYDSTGAPIADLIYSYYVQPDTPPSMASITQNRMGTTATLTHALNLLNGTVSFGPTGKVIVTVRSVYRGEERWGSSAPISLI